jgi:hypothetical protein
MAADVVRNILLSAHEKANNIGVVLFMCGWKRGRARVEYGGQVKRRGMIDVNQTMQKSQRRPKHIKKSASSKKCKKPASTELFKIVTSGKQCTNMTSTK